MESDKKSLRYLILKSHPEFYPTDEKQILFLPPCFFMYSDLGHLLCYMKRHYLRFQENMGWHILPAFLQIQPHQKTHKAKNIQVR